MSVNTFCAMKRFWLQNARILQWEDVQASRPSATRTRGSKMIVTAEEFILLTPESQLALAKTMTKEEIQQLDESLDLKLKLMRIEAIRKAISGAKR